MTLTATIIVLAALAVVLIAGLALVMAQPGRLRPHRRRGGRPSARMRWHQRRGNSASR